MPVTPQAVDPAAHRLLVLGNVPVDLVMRVDALPESGDDVRAHAVEARPGGAYHVMMAARGGGLRCSFAGTHGVGVYGEAVRTALAAIGVATLQPTLRGVDTGIVLTLVDSIGERTFVTADNAVQPFTDQMLTRLHTEDFTMAYVSGYSLGLGPASAPLAQWVGALGDHAVVLCDLGPRGTRASDAVLDPVLRRVDWLSCNRREAAALTGIADPEEACEALGRRTRAAGVLLRDGAEGCWYAEPGGSPRLVEGPSRADSVDTTGAGDVHSGGFLAALAAGFDIPAAVALAGEAASYWVSRAGTVD